MADVLTEILRAANKHPNSRVTKLIQTVEEEPSQKNIVLLLVELGEHAEYSIDFDVSLKYYLDLFECVTQDLVLNEAGLLLVNSSKIYSKRVDYVHSLVERQILALSNADDELQKQRFEQQETERVVPVEKPKRGRKRALEAPCDPYEVELAPKKFKKLTEDKRFALPKTIHEAKSASSSIEMEQYIHPAGWQYAAIYDLENDEDVDTKRNYKLFTYHVEHRYNTLVPDINFRLHFKVKDYIDEQEEMEETEACNTNRIWPPLSEAYVQKYLNLENYVLQQDKKASKRKTTDEKDAIHNLTKKPTDFIVAEGEPVNEFVDGNNISALEKSLFHADSGESLVSSLGNKTQENLESSTINEKNDSGLGLSLLDKTNSTSENSQISCYLETSTILVTSNDLNTSDVNKSLNATKSKTENDSALGTSILDHSTNIDNYTSLEENTKNVKTTANEKNINDSNLIEANVTESQTENDSALDNSRLDQTTNTANDTTTEETIFLETTQENSEVFDTIANNEKAGVQSDVEDFSEDTKNKENAALVPAETLTLCQENANVVHEENGKNLEIDLVQQHDKDTTQIRVHLPHADDEGVYLSDLEEHDCCLLSPIINTRNMLPDVERKDVTILLDDELRQALEMRDGIMKHFSYETYKVPIFTETIKQKLIFNIFKLPEKLLRRKILFKLGPDMDLYLQARSFKRCKPEPVARVTRSTMLQWYSLNNTDMTGVSITPPSSPGHTSMFYGFTDDEDSISCADFCGFTEMEQSAIRVKDISRLSRDSGVGVDANNIVQDALEIIIEENENSAVENGKRDINLDEAQTTESILNELPSEIRDVLTNELEDNKNNNAIEANRDLEEATTSLNNTEETEKLCTITGEDDSETVQRQNCYSNNTEELFTESSIETLTTEQLSANNTQKSDGLAESSSATQTSTDHITIDNSEDNECKSKPSDIKINIESSNNTTKFKNSDVDMSNDELTTTAQSDKSTDLLKEKIGCETAMEKYLHDSVKTSACVDEVILDLSAQGNRTKIQKWHEHLQPILAKSRERHHFDVYKLGTEIIDTVKCRRKSNDDFKFTSASCNSHVASFQDIMDDKDKSYVSRYFLSTLLLANQSNIEISLSNKSSEKPSSWDDINLKLLSTTRHTVAIEDNIGMIDNKQNAEYKNCKQTTNNYQNKEEDGEEDKALIKLKNIKKSFTELKITVKRSSDNPTTSYVAEKKLKAITSVTNSRHTELTNLIQSVQIINPPFVTVPSSMDTSIIPKTSRQAIIDVNINAIQTLQPIKKVQKSHDDHDSGIFSIDETFTS